MRKRSRLLRKNQTETEIKFWNYEQLQNTNCVLEKIYQKLIELPDSPRYSNKKILSPSSHEWERSARQRGCGENPS